MSNHSVKFHKGLISSFWIVLLTDRQTDTGVNITSLADINMFKTFNTRHQHQPYALHSTNGTLYTIMNKNELTTKMNIRCWLWGVWCVHQVQCLGSSPEIHRSDTQLCRQSAQWCMTSETAEASRNASTCRHACHTPCGTSYGRMH